MIVDQFYNKYIEKAERYEYVIALSLLKVTTLNVCILGNQIKILVLVITSAIARGKDRLRQRNAINR